MGNFVPVEEVAEEEEEAGVETFPFMGGKPVAEVTIPFGKRPHAVVAATTTCTTATATTTATDRHTQVNHPKIKATTAIMACTALTHRNGLIDYPTRMRIPTKRWERPNLGIPMPFRRDGP